MIARLISLVPALVLALLAQSAHAQFLYKSTMPDGKVVYGDVPMKGAVKVEKTKPDTSKKGISAATPNEAAALKKLENSRGVGEDPRTERIRTLEEAIRKLEASREAGREPLEGERIGKVGGGSRFTDDYLERQKKLDEGIETLRKELEKARAAK